MSNVFTFELGNQTYSTKKSNITLQGQLFDVTASVIEAMDCKTTDELQRKTAEAGDNSTISVRLIGALCRLLPPLFWEYLPNESKNQIGGYDAFLEGLDNALVGRFWQWVNTGAAEAANFTVTPSDKQPAA